MAAAMPQEKKSPSASRRPPVVADRVRVIAGSFAFIPHRFLHDGFLASLSQDERSLYLFLVLAGDRNGVSFYRYDSICAVLECSLDDYLRARNGLIDKDLLAFDGTRYQVLSLPPRPTWRSSKPLLDAADLEANDPATVRRLIRDDTSK
jgi:hypothetical protein